MSIDETGCRREVEEGCRWCDRGSTSFAIGPTRTWIYPVQWDNIPLPECLCSIFWHSLFSGQFHERFTFPHYIYIPTLAKLNACYDTIPILKSTDLCTCACIGVCMLGVVACASVLLRARMRFYILDNTGLCQTDRGSNINLVNFKKVVGTIFTLNNSF